MVALVVRLFYIQVITGEELAKKAERQQVKSIVVPAKRGDILDRNGDRIAFSMKTYSVWANATNIMKPNETGALIAETIEEDAKAISDAIINSKTSFVKVATDLTKSEADLIRSKNIWGISITEDTKRIYPYGNLASHVIGNVNADNEGFLGLEMHYNTLLKGEPGLHHITTDVHGRQLAYGEENLSAPINGKSIRLTLDDSIQYFLETRLEDALMAENAKTVSAIVMDPNSGEIIGMASKPDYDLNNPREKRADVSDETWAEMTNEDRVTYWHSIWKNPILSNTYEPGSTFKAVTSAIALEEHLVEMDDSFHCNGYTTVNGIRLKCWIYPASHGHETFLQAFVNSCNPTFVEVAKKIGAETFYDYLDQFGLFEKTGIDLPNEANSISLPFESVGPIELATLSYGHGINVTMLQMTRVISAFVNGGYLMKPQLVKEVIDETGEVILEFAPEIEERIISQETSDKMKDLFTAAVGSNKHRAYIDGITVGGKSGTSTKMVGSEYQEDVVVSSFVGIAPMENPEYVVLVVVDEPQVGSTGTEVAAPIVRSILEDIFRYRNVVPDISVLESVEIPNLIGLPYEEAIEMLDKVGLQYSTEPIVIEDSMQIILDQFPKAGTKVDKNTIVILSVES